jgi:Flp pilus assembly protein TadG
MKLLTKNFNSQSGAAAVEFAFVLLPLLLLVFGIIEFGFYMFNRQILTNACREGARYGVVSRTPRHTVEEIKNVVTGFSENHMILSGNPHISFNNVSACTATFGSDLLIDANYNYKLLLLPNFLNRDGYVIEVATRMKCE